MNYRKGTSAILGGVWLLCASSVQAQEAPQSPWQFEIDAALAHQSETDLSDSDGTFEVDRWFLSGGVSYAWNRRNSVGLTLGTGKSSYVFDELNGIGNGAHWGAVEDYRASLSARFRISERGTAIVIPSLRVNREKGADWGDSRSWGLFAAAAWRLSPDLTIGPGFGLFEKLDGGTRAFPILFVDWNINDRWNLATGRGLAASQGPGLTLSYQLSEVWQLALTGRYENLEFRLDDDGPAPGGIGRDRSFPLVLSARFDMGASAYFSVFAGLEFGGELKLKDTQGVTLEESEYDPAPIFGVTGQIRF